MALIKCPECGREKVSDTAVACPDCGFPIREHFEKIQEAQEKAEAEKDLNNYEQAMAIFDATEQSSTKYFCKISDVYRNEGREEAMAYIMKEGNCTSEAADQILKEIFDDYVPPLIERRQNTYSPQPNIPTCPTCRSTKITKISNTSRLVSTGFWGLGSKKIGKTFKCSNCGYMW